MSKSILYELPTHLQNRVHEIIRFIKSKSKATDIACLTKGDRCQLVFVFSKARDAKEDIAAWVEEFVCGEQSKPVSFFRCAWQSRV